MAPRCTGGLLPWCAFSRARVRGRRRICRSAWAPDDLPVRVGPRVAVASTHDRPLHARVPPGQLPQAFPPSPVRAALDPHPEPGRPPLRRPRQQPARADQRPRGGVAEAGQHVADVVGALVEPGQQGQQRDQREHHQPARGHQPVGVQQQGQAQGDRGGRADVTRGEAAVGHQPGVQDPDRRPVAVDQVGRCEVDDAHPGVHHHDEEQRSPGAYDERDHGAGEHDQRRPDRGLAEEGAHVRDPREARRTTVGEPARDVVVPAPDRGDERVGQQPPDPDHDQHQDDEGAEEGGRRTQWVTGPLRCGEQRHGGIVPVEPGRCLGDAGTRTIGHSRSDRRTHDTQATATHTNPVPSG